MARPVSFIKQSYLDFSNEKSAVGVPVTTLTAGNFTAEMANLVTLSAALAAVTLGNLVGFTVEAERLVNLGIAPVNVNAQREKKWLVRYHDATTLTKYTAEIPCADLSILLAASDFADPASGPFVALKAAWETVVRSPDDNNLTIFDSMQFVGRRL
jgi:hypothetical protein